MDAFVDSVTIEILAGHGGNGSVSFRREKYVPKGGPDGGDGGQGGSVTFVGSRRLRTLLDHRYRRRYAAEKGRPGEGSNRTGRSGEDLEIQVPLGTLVIDADTGETLGDVVSEGQRLLAARGGKGGRGNAAFASPTHQTPRESEPGRPGQERRCRLELKLLADVGIIGLPNAGKSTLLARITAARPKVAPYPFTTLTPNLGVVKVSDLRSFVVADIPGIIAGAHAGAGLGLRFLRHVERTRLLLCLVDVSGQADRPPAEALATLRTELAAYSADLAERPFVIAATKMDDPEAAGRLPELQAAAGGQTPVIPISAIEGHGLKELVAAVNERLGELPGDEPRDWPDGPEVAPEPEPEGERR